MIPFVCDHPDRLAARIFVAAKTDCPCCTFWRGVLLGLLFGAAVTAIVAAVLSNN